MIKSTNSWLKRSINLSTFYFSVYLMYIYYFKTAVVEYIYYVY